MECEFTTIYLVYFGKLYNLFIISVINKLLQLTITFIIMVVYRAMLGEKFTIENWIQCKILWQIGLGNDEKCPQSEVPTLVSYPITLAHYAIVTSLGTFSFLVSGTKKELFAFYINLFLFISRREWGQLKDHIMKKQKRKSAASITPTPTPRPSPPASLSPHRAISLNILPPAPSSSPSPAHSIFSSREDPSLQIHPSPTLPSSSAPPNGGEEYYDILETATASLADSTLHMLTDIPLATIHTSTPPANTTNLSDSHSSLSSSSSSSISPSASLPHSPIFPASLDIFTDPS